MGWRWGWGCGSACACAVHVQCIRYMVAGCAGSDARERVHADRAEAPREDSGPPRLERFRRGDGGGLATVRIPVEAIRRLLAIREHNHHPASIRPGCIEVRRLESYALHLSLSERPLGEARLGLQLRRARVQRSVKDLAGRGSPQLRRYQEASFNMLRRASLRHRTLAAPAPSHLRWR